MPHASREEIDSKKDHLARSITDLHFERHPELDKRYGPIGRVKCLEDARYHLGYLAEAVGNSSPALFADYVRWAKFMLEGRGVPASDLADNLLVIREVLNNELSAPSAALTISCVDTALEHLQRSLHADQTDGPRSELPCRITEENPLRQLATDYLQALLRGDRRAASEMIMEAVESGTSIKELYLYVFQPSQHEVGRLWQINQLSVAQEHYCSAATQLIMSQLYPYLFSNRRRGKSMVATCVSGDLHEIGIRMISDFFEIEGWDTFYLGANVPVDSVIRTIKDRKAQLLAISATMTFHIHSVRRLIKAVRSDESIASTIILVGGYPFNLAPSLWKELGADGFALDAEHALALAHELLPD